MKRCLQALILLLAPAWVVTAQSDMPPAQDFGAITSSNLTQPNAPTTNKMTPEHYFQAQLESAIRQRHEKNPALAIGTLVAILETNAPAEFKRKALFELALATQDNNELVRAQQIYAQYLQRYPEDPSAPEALLRQGLLFRQMGVNTLAISKFYAVMSTALKLKLNNIDYYRNLVLEAQTEIADTYYAGGQYTDAADFYARLLKAGILALSKPQIDYKLIRSLSYLTNRAETITRAQAFLQDNPDNANVPEVRFILANAYKAAGRNQEAMKQVLLLLQSQQDNARSNPETWAYWQRRAGNEIANQLYKEADYLDALEIYQNVAALDTAPSWQAPALYQVGLVYEQLQQWQMATNTYGKIIGRRADLTGSNAPPSLSSLYDMAQWRIENIAWMQKAHAANLQFQRSFLYKEPAAAK